MVCCSTTKNPLKAGYNVAMEFTDYMWLKFWVVVFLAFCYGFYRAFTGTEPAEPAQSDTEQEKRIESER
jgi:hypothetical protein